MIFNVLSLLYPGVCPRTRLVRGGDDNLTICELPPSRVILHLPVLHRVGVRFEVCLYYSRILVVNVHRVV